MAHFFDVVQNKIFHWNHNAIQFPKLINCKRFLAHSQNTRRLKFKHFLTAWKPQIFSSFFFVMLCNYSDFFTPLWCELQIVGCLHNQTDCISNFQLVHSNLLFIIKGNQSKEISLIYVFFLLFFSSFLRPPNIVSKWNWFGIK